MLTCVQFGNLLMRSQIDCADPRLPNAKFDLKTRAVIAIRMDAANYLQNIPYRLRSLQGLYESFEREYYDMIRSAFLKYSYQCRIGKMDGIFVAFHNTAEIFGFQYISIEEMDRATAGNEQSGQVLFQNGVRLLHELLNDVIKRDPIGSNDGSWAGAPLRMLIGANQTDNMCHIYVEKVQKEGDAKLKQVRKFNVSLKHKINGERVAAFTLDEKNTPWQTTIDIVELHREEMDYVRRQYDEQRRKLRDSALRRIAMSQRAAIQGAPSTGIMAHLKKHFMSEEKNALEDLDDEDIIVLK